MKLTRKANAESTSHYRCRVGPGWLKYEYNGSVWNLDDGACRSRIRVKTRSDQQEQIQTILSLPGDSKSKPHMHKPT